MQITVLNNTDAKILAVNKIHRTPQVQCSTHIYIYILRVSHQNGIFLQ